MHFDEYLTKSFPAYAKVKKHKQFILVLSVVIGIWTGLAALILKNSVHYFEEFVRNLSNVDQQNYYYLFLPIIGISLTSYFTNRIIKDDIGHGVTKVLYSLSRGKAKIKKHNLYSSMAACSVTTAFGGSVGMEAPILSTGAAIGSNTAQWFGQGYKTRTLLVGAGAAGAIAAIFKAPIAGMIFALEVFALDLTATSIIPLLITAVTSSLVTTFLLGSNVEFYFALRDKFNYSHFHYYILLGIFSGFVSMYFLRTNALIEKIFKKYSRKNRIIVGALLLGLLLFLFPPLYGEGYNAMKLLLSGKMHDLANNSFFYSFTENSWMFVLYLFMILIFKVIATSFTTGAGGVGGVFAPALFTGGISGAIFSKVLLLFGIAQVSQNNFTLVGMAGLISGVIQAPLTAIFLIAEITGGYGLFIPLIITSSISFLTVQVFEPYSIYTKSLAEKGDLITHDKDKTILTLMNIKELIETSFIPVSEDMSLRQLTEIIAQSKRNLFPVLDNQHKLIGIVNLDDVRPIMFDQEKYDKVFVRNLMTKPSLTLSLDDKMDAAMQVLKSQNVWNVPVLDHGLYLGFISKSNLLNVYRKVMNDISQND